MQNIISELPLVALVGPTNAGKSTLFNRLTGSWQAVTAKEESTTRDRVYGEVEWQNQLFSIVDTGGLADDDSDLYEKIHRQTKQAIDEADLIIFLYDGKAGLLGRDKIFLDGLRGKKNVWLVANKIDTFDVEKKTDKLDNIGFPYFEISAASGRGTGDLLEDIIKFIPIVPLIQTRLPLIALVGRPNVGKSTLLNALTESERAVVSPIAGTTRDIVTGELELYGRKYLLADTAGVRRRGHIEIGAESFSVKRTQTAIAEASAVIVLIDATAGTTRGDIHLIYKAHELKKPVLLVFNKIDLLERDASFFAGHLQKKFDHIAISAKNNQNIHEVGEWIQKNVY